MPAPDSPAAAPETGAMRIAISGASGLIGRRLCAELEGSGHQVWRLVRGGQVRELRGRKRELRERSEAGGREVPWDPREGVLRPETLEGLDAVVHLAGENLAAGRWNPARKADIRDSRVTGTQSLCRSLAGLGNKPRLLISASAIGIYGNRGEAWVDEDSVLGQGYLAEVCQGWEAATEAAQQAGIRVVHLRTGLVLAREGGALAKMRLPFSLGLGGPIGNGRQYMSWISMTDLLRAIVFQLEREGFSGPVNAISPQPVTNREFARTLGRSLGRPAFLPLPAKVVRLAFGEMGEALLLAGQRVAPKRLAEAGFDFAHPGLDEALASET